MTISSFEIPDQSATFSIPFRHIWKAEFPVNFENAVRKPSGLSHFIGDQSNAILSYFSSDPSTARNHFDSGKFSWPLVFFGPPGTGKTSLAMAILSDLASNSDSKPIFLSAADFDRKYRTALETNSLTSFQQSFVNSAGIFIDDIHQIAHKKGTQDLIANLLDDCVKNATPVVVTLNQQPVRSSDIIAKLSSRLVQGLCLPVHPPGSLARRRIIAEFAKQYDLNLTADAVDRLVELLPVSVPNLNHFFAQLKLAADVKKDSLQPEHLLNINKSTLDKLMRPSDEEVGLMADHISNAVANEFHMSHAEIKSERRSQSIVQARNIAIFLQRELLQLSFSKIGAHFGNRDHSTIMHSYQKTRKAFEDKADNFLTNIQLISRLKKELTEQFLNQGFACFAES